MLDSDLLALDFLLISPICMGIVYLFIRRKWIAILLGLVLGLLVTIALAIMYPAVLEHFLKFMIVAIIIFAVIMCGPSSKGDRGSNNSSNDCQIEFRDERGLYSGSGKITGDCIEFRDKRGLYSGAGKITKK